MIQPFKKKKFYVVFIGNYRFLLYIVNKKNNYDFYLFVFVLFIFYFFLLTTCFVFCRLGPQLHKCLTVIIFVLNKNKNSQFVYK